MASPVKYISLTIILFALLVLLTQANVATVPVAAQNGVQVVDNLSITQNTTLAPGVYQLKDANQDGIIQINADNITLDGSGVTLIGDGTGYGIKMNGHTGLTLHNFNISGFFYGISISNASNVVIQNSNISGNHKDTTSSGLFIELGAYYGGGILFDNVNYSTVQSNTLTNESTGLEMINSSFDNVLNNTTSSGPANNETGQDSCWGIRLQGSSSNLVRGNIADYVDRLRYKLSSGDAAGLLLVSGSNSNRIISNSLTHGGDGFFLGNLCSRASNNNYVYGNDGSYSPNNAFECTFSDGNTFENNTASNSNFGFWLGYSHNTHVLRNQIDGNTDAGIAVEHGHDNEFDHNTITRNERGIHLWADDNTCAADPGCGQSCPSFNYRIHHNNITLNTRGLEVENTSPLTVSRNQLSNNNNQNLYFASTSSQITVWHNNVSCQNSIAVAENLAYGKTATDSQGTGTASNALDGVVFNQNSSWNANNPLNPGDWWQVDLGTIKTVSEVALYPYYGNLSDFPDHFHIDGSTTGVFGGEQVRLVTETSRIRHQMLVYDFAATSARYIRLVSDDPPKNWVRMMEFAAFTQTGHYPVQCQYAAYNNMAAGYNVSAPRNWWGTTNVTTINSLIFDHNDDATKGYVYYTPYLPEPIPATSGANQTNLGNWTSTTSLPQSSAAPFNDRGQQLVFYNNHVYLFGGQDSSGVPQTAVYYSTTLPDGTLGPWTATTSLPGQFYDHVLVRVGNHVYFITGAAGASAVYYATIQANGTLSAWTSTTALSPSRQSFAAVAYGNYIYASGGNSGGPLNIVKYAPVNTNGTLGSWSSTTSLPETMQAHAMVAYDDYLYVLAPNGHVYDAPINNNGTVGAWTATTSLPQAMNGYAAFEQDGYIYLLGGGSNAVYYAAINDDGTLGAWQSATSLPSQVQSLRIGASNGYVYALGGYDGTSYRNNVYYSQLGAPAGCQGGETLISPFTSGLYGATTSLTYTGLDTITVSGVGQASGSNYGDAFYLFADGSGSPISPPQHYTSQYNWVLAINGQHAEAFTPGQQVPAYRADHRYSFQIQAPSGALTFGVSDGYGPDNTGSYLIGLCGGTP